MHRFLPSLKFIYLWFGACALFAIPVQAEPRAVDQTVFLTVVEAHLASGDLRGGDTPTLVGNFIHTGDRTRFISAVDNWLKGVVVDPDYLAATQGAGVPAFTQPSGWTGFSQSLIQSLEQRYNGYIILARFDLNNPTDVVTATHEAIHAYALATGSGLDADADGGPEYLSNQFIGQLLPKLQEIEFKHFKIAFSAAWNCEYDVVEREVELWLTAIAEQRYIYSNFAAHNMRNTRALLATWGGELDWDGYTDYVSRLTENDTRDDCD